MLLALIGWAGFELYGSMRAEAIVAQISTAQTAELPVLVKSLQHYRRWASKPLEALIASDDVNVQWRGRVALLPGDARHVAAVQQYLLTAHPDEVDVLRRALLPYADRVSEDLWRVVEQPDRSPRALLPAASALALYEPASPRWQGVRIASRRPW